VPRGRGSSWRPWSLDQPVSLAQPGRVSNDQPWAATQPRCVSNTWPMFIRLGTPSGLRMTSIGVPSARKGMSSSGRILEMTPLLPWRAGRLLPVPVFRLLGPETPHQRVAPRVEVVAGLPGEHPHADDLAGLAVGDLQGGVPDLAGLLPEDGPQQALLGGQLGLALGRDLADQDVAGVDLGPDADDAPLVEVLEHVLGDVGDVAGDLLGPELGVAGVDLVLLDVDRGQDVVLDQALGEDDGVLVVVALPGHERHQEVLAQRQLAGVGAGPVGQHVAGGALGGPAP